MQLIEPKVEIINEVNLFKKIEIAGRTCYKSENNITDESAIKFTNNLIKREHTAMLEHATVLFDLTSLYKECVFSVVARSLVDDIDSCKYLNTTYNTIYNRYLVSGNIRAVNESGIDCLIHSLYNVYPELAYKRFSDKTMTFPIVNLNDLTGVSSKEYLKHCYTTMRFTCDRGVTHEIVRHRPFSFAQESTRYVKYNNRNMEFITPADFDKWDNITKQLFIEALHNSEISYNELMNTCKLTAQQARAILPNAIKTEIVITGNAKEWTHFFNLRYKGTTGAPHPDMKIVAEMAYHKYNDHNHRLLLSIGDNI